MQKATFHAATDFKGMTVGLSGSVANPAALNYVFAPNKNTVLETDLKNYTLHLYNKVDASTAIAARTSWETGSANSDFAVAVEKTLASGADFSVKAGVSGTVDLAHVSNLSDGVKMTLGAQLTLSNGPILNSAPDSSSASKLTKNRLKKINLRPNNRNSTTQVNLHMPIMYLLEQFLTKMLLPSSEV